MEPIENETLDEMKAELNHWQEMLSAATSDAENRTDQVQDAYLGEVHSKVDEACALVDRAERGDDEARNELHGKVQDVRTLFKRMERQTTSGGPPLA